MITKAKICGYRIFRNLEFTPNQRLNLLVGANESGKSTLMEAIVLALTGRINGRRASEELNPYWFNTESVDEFIQRRRSRERVRFPEIHIELFLEDRDDLQQLCGAINTETPTKACPGISMRILPNPDYADDLNNWSQNPSPILPVEYYMDDWRDFGDNKITNRPRQLVTAIIDSRTVRSTTGIDYHLREILGDHLEPAEKAAISLAYRQVKASLSDDALKTVNQRIGTLHATLHDRPISLAMDQSARTSWEWAVTPHVDRVPFSMSGQGQQAAIKISLAMSRQSDRANFVMVEEPENHLSHTSLGTLLSRMASLAGAQQQIFVTTHSSFVLNRLGLDSLLLIGPNEAVRMPDLDPGTVTYFQKLPGYDTLRMVLARKIVLVEGPSDEIVFERIFRDIHGCRPIDCGIDVLSMRGLSFAHCLELCAALDKNVAAVRDNDGADPVELRTSLQEWLSEGRRELFVGATEHGKTLEPQLLHFNGEFSLRQVLGVTVQADLLTWMTRRKTDAALRIAESPCIITPPNYMRAACEFIHG
jgi:energy-coupling factor transporter ATP-binding protein EcfA2